jgi:hypothetical protein
MRNNRREFIRMAALGAAGDSLLPRISVSQGRPKRRAASSSISHQHYDQRLIALTSW